MAPLIPTTTGTPAEASAEAPAAKKGKKKKLLILVLVLALVGAGAYETVLQPKPKAKAAVGKDGKPVKAAAGKPVAGDTITLEPVTTSVSDGHVIQIALGLELIKGADAKAIATLAPQADDAANRVLAHYTYKQLLSPAGREKAHLEITKAVSKAIVDGKGKTEIFDVYLPTYVLQ
jgi:flagellar FliL protein